MDFKVVIFAFLCGLAIASCESDYYTYPVADEWKQCAWKFEDQRDQGQLRVCDFRKSESSTALKVTYTGDMRSNGDKTCSRWYFKFNGRECTGPMTIDAVIYNHWPSGQNPNLHRHGSFMGYCENLPSGHIRVELWLGGCGGGHPLGNANTGFGSVSRIMVEEVPRSQ